MKARDRSLKMVAEALREIGVLYTVFVPLENMYSEISRPFLVTSAITIAFGCGSFLCGVYLEHVTERR